METFFAKERREKPVTDEQLDLVIGSLLGDGYLAKTTSGHAFRVNHGLAQRSYVLWKYKILEDLVRSAPKQSGSCFFFRTITHEVFSSLHSQFYEGSRKRLPIQLLKDRLNSFMLAVWFMDDGSRDWHAVRLNSQCFSFEENQLLQEFLQAKFGIKTRLNRDKKHFRIRILTECMQRFVELIKPFVIPDMLYKIPL